MKICVDLQFEVPIWRLFYEHDEVNKIPYSFIFKNKKYTNGITIIHKWLII